MGMGRSAVVDTRYSLSGGAIGIAGTTHVLLLLLRNEETRIGEAFSNLKRSFFVLTSYIVGLLRVQCHQWTSTYVIPMEN